MRVWKYKIKCRLSQEKNANCQLKRLQRFNKKYWSLQIYYKFFKVGKTYLIRTQFKTKYVILSLLQNILFFSWKKKT